MNPWCRSLAMIVVLCTIGNTFLMAKHPVNMIDDYMERRSEVIAAYTKEHHQQSNAHRFHILKSCEYFLAACALSGILAANKIDIHEFSRFLHATRMARIAAATLALNNAHWFYKKP